MEFIFRRHDFYLPFKTWIYILHILRSKAGIVKCTASSLKFETAGQMTVGYIRSYKFVRFGLLKGTSTLTTE